jgi:hypothetical protein
VNSTKSVADDLGPAPAHDVVVLAAFAQMDLGAEVAALFFVAGLFWREALSSFQPGLGRRTAGGPPSMPDSVTAI